MNSSTLELHASSEEQKEKKEEMRIIDFLTAEDDFNNTSRDSVLFSSPRSILSRWFSSFKRSKEHRTSSRRFASSGSEKKRDDEGSKEESSQIILEKSASASKSDDSSGKYMKDLSVNLGLGVGLGFLIAASKNEFNRMMELQTQMKMLIKEVKGEMQRKYVISKPFESNDDIGLSSRSTNYIKEVNDEMQRKYVISKPFESNDNLSFSATNSPEVGSTNYHPIIQSCPLSHHLLETEVPMESGLHSKCDTLGREGGALGIDQMEAELEAELERLQLSLDVEDLSENPLQQAMEIDGMMIVENTAPDGSHGTCFGEVNDSQEADGSEHCRVSPYDLERRLHELLEARQKERIKELEIALACAKRELHKREMEIARWKDIAELISQHVLEAPHLSK